METDQPNVDMIPDDSIKDLGDRTAELIPNKSSGEWDVVESDGDEESFDGNDVVYVEPPKGLFLFFFYIFHCYNNLLNFFLPWIIIFQLKL